MNTDHAADISVLPYGSGLAIALLLIIGLPREPRSGSAVANPHAPRLNLPVSSRLAKFAPEPPPGIRPACS
jgi:hypothetical protein